MAPTAPADPSLFTTRVRELVTHPPVTCTAECTAIELARLLSRERVGSVIVLDGQGAPIGIVTDRDLRRKVVAEGRDASTVPARQIMSAPLVTIEPSAFAFDAVLEMTRRGIHHLVVVETGRLAGVVSTYDLLRLQAVHPVTLAREIDRAASIDALAAVGRRIAPLVRHLVDAGARATDVGQVVAELNDRLVARVLALTGDALAAGGTEAAPASWCWLVMGSEARREQTLRTDQDNGLVYADPPPERAQETAACYRRFAERAIEGLVAIGVPRCPANLMASNPQWCQPLSAWSACFRQWMKEAWPDQVAAAITIFDLRPVAGASELAAPLLDLIRDEAPDNPAFLGVLAREAVSMESSLGLLGRIGVERRGPHRGAIDVKRAGIQQLVGAGRVHALELGLRETSTADRIRAAAERGVYNPEVLQETLEAYEFLMRLRLVHQLEQVERGVPPDNWIEPARLSRADRALLREALGAVERVKTLVSRRYGLASLPGP